MVFIFLTGCASVSVRESRVSRHSPEKLPKRIYVSAFSTKDAAFHVDREGQELKEFKAKTAGNLQIALTERLRELAPSELTPKVGLSSGWLIKGKFVRVNQGSRALRTAVGFGAGATKMETEVQIFDLKRSSVSPFLSFITTGGSNAEPGALSSLGPVTWLTGVGIIAGGAGNALHGLSEDSDRTAREIRNRLVDYCIEKKLVTAEWAKTRRFQVNDPRSEGTK